jgi:hypothetical protein
MRGGLFPGFPYQVRRMDLDDSTLDVFAELAAAAPELPEAAGHRHNSDTDSSSLISRDSLTFLSSSDSEENQGEEGDDKENSGAKKGKRAFHKEIHNVCERRRRENMREAFASLQRKIYPDGSSVSRVSKMDLLKGAVEKIERVKKEVAVLEAEAARRNIAC